MMTVNKHFYITQSQKKGQKLGSHRGVLKQKNKRKQKKKETRKNAHFQKFIFVKIINCLLTLSSPMLCATTTSLIKNNKHGNSPLEWMCAKM